MSSICLLTLDSVCIQTTFVGLSSPALQQVKFEARDVFAPLMRFELRLSLRTPISVEGPRVLMRTSMSCIISLRDSYVEP